MKAMNTMKMLRLFLWPSAAEIKAARIRKNRSDGAKRGAATRRANKERALLDVKPETQDGQPALTD